MLKTGTALAFIAGLALASGSAFAGEEADKAAADEAMNTFIALDANGDSVIDQQEAAADPALAEQFSVLDQDGDGALTYDDFEAYAATGGTMKEDTEG